MNLRIPESPPEILPVSSKVNRPLFSVMIPVYNCKDFLKDAIKSVLAQDFGTDKMQIEIVDDCSTDGDIASLVQQIGRGRVDYYKQPHNKGSLRNFETCLNRSRGYWVHLLHGDDKVKEGFYSEIESLFNQFPQAGAAFTRHTLIDEKGNEFFRINPIVAEVDDKPCILNNWLANIAQRNRLQPPAIVVKREVYEQLGSFYAVHFGEDWEMWVRIAAKFPVAYSPRHLAMYRFHTTNITSRAFLTGQNITDLKKVMGIIQNYLPEDQKSLLLKQAQKNTAEYLMRTARKVLHTYQHPRAAFLQAKGALTMYPSRKNIVIFLKLLLKTVKLYLKKLQPGWNKSYQLTDRIRS